MATDIALPKTGSESAGVSLACCTHDGPSRTKTYAAMVPFSPTLLAPRTMVLPLIATEAPNSSPGFPSFAVSFVSLRPADAVRGSRSSKHTPTAQAAGFLPRLIKKFLLIFALQTACSSPASTPHVERLLFGFIVFPFGCPL